MRAGFDQVRVRMGDEIDLAYAAETIIQGHRLRQLTATISGADVADDLYLADQCAIVGNYGRWLRLGVLRRTEVYDADVLSNTKDTIGGALKVCASRLPLSEEEIVSLGDMYFYLSYFHEEWDPSREGNEQAPFAKSIAEERGRRSEWTADIFPKSPSRFSRLISSWLKPNA